MKILVISDSHGKTVNIKLVLKKHDVDKVFFLGDYITDVEHLDISNEIDVVKVKGNLDRNIEGLDDIVLDIEGVKIFLTHGHLYNVKFNLFKLFLKAREEECDIAFYGHTHQYNRLKKGDMIIANPGSIAKPRGQDYCSYILLDVNNGDFKMRKHRIKS